LKKPKTGAKPGLSFEVTYTEEAKVGYKWYETERKPIRSKPTRRPRIYLPEMTTLTGLLIPPPVNAAELEIAVPSLAKALTPRLPATHRLPWPSTAIDDVVPRPPPVKGVTAPVGVSFRIDPALMDGVQALPS